jgi:preprotein translocase subunit Sec61beta
MALSTPQQQAGILSFYDAPEKGPKMNVRLVVAFVVLFSIIVMVADHFLALA